ncbi:MAG: glycosyltransferase family 4 protein [Thermoplasmata archaeon]
MRIIWLIWRDFNHPAHGGATIYMREVSQRLAARGHEVLVLTSSYPGAASSETIGGVRINRIGADWNVGFLGAIMLFLKILPRAEVVIDDFNVFPFWTPITQKKGSLLLVHHLAGDVLDRYDLNPLTRWGISVLQKLLLVLYEGGTTITPSVSTRSELLRHGFRPRDVILCPPGLPEVPDPLQESPLKRPEPQAIYLGRVVPQKGIELVIRAFRLALEEIPTARLLICGRADPRYHQKLKGLIDSLQISGSVHLMGYVSAKEKARLLQESHVFVAHSSKEGWGIAAMESMSYGTPVIASDVPGLRELIRDGVTGWLVEWGNVSELSEKIVDVLQEAKDPTSKYTEIADACRGEVRAHGFDSTVSLFEETLRRVANS